MGKPDLAGWLYAPGGAGNASLVLHGGPSRTQVLVLASHAPRSVSVNGVVLSRAGGASALRGMSAGWMFSRGAFGGVMVKVSGARGAITVRISS